MSDDEEDRRLALEKQNIQDLFGNVEIINSKTTVIYDGFDYSHFEERPTMKEVRHTDTPLARLHMGFQIRGWNKPEISYHQEEKTKAWSVEIDIGSHKFNGRSSTSQGAAQIAASKVLEWIIEWGWSTKGDENSFMLPLDKQEALDLIQKQREEYDNPDLPIPGDPAMVFNE